MRIFGFLCGKQLLLLWVEEVGLLDDGESFPCASVTDQRLDDPRERTVKVFTECFELRLRVCANPAVELRASAFVALPVAFSVGACR